MRNKMLLDLKCTYSKSKGATATTDINLDHRVLVGEIEIIVYRMPLVLTQKWDCCCRHGT